MQEKKIKFTDVLFVGLAFFASYFGAGNLIFPPMLGLQSGSNWLSGMIGMLASGVGLPILAIIVLGMCGSVQKISDHVNKKFYTVMIGAIMILCCCVSIPRTAAVGIEMGLQGIWPGAPYLIFVILYFVIAFLFAKDRGTALDKVGKILTPIMTIILFILVVKGAVSPIGTPGTPPWITPLSTASWVVTAPATFWCPSWLPACSLTASSARATRVKPSARPMSGPA